MPIAGNERTPYGKAEPSASYVFVEVTLSLGIQCGRIPQTQLTNQKIWTGGKYVFFEERVAARAGLLRISRIVLCANIDDNPFGHCLRSDWRSCRWRTSNGHQRGDRRSF